LIPFVNIILLFILGALPGTSGTNRFGQDPKAGHTIAAQR